jgi:CubicO group peptidase (beta-lactamase class C family)
MMKHRTQILTVLAAASALAFTGAAAYATSDRRIQEFLDATIPKGPGGTVVAVRDGKLVHCGGFGYADREAKIPARCDTAYDIMSMTKQFTAAAVLKLEMEGRLRVGDRIGRYLGRLPADKRGITIHQLLTHTSGLDDIGDDYARVSREVMLKNAEASRLLFAPGVRFHYSNLGYSILAAIIEKASGLPYERYLSTRIFRPAGMTRTGYVLPRWCPREVAVEYDRHGVRQGRPYEHPWALDGPYWYLRGNGGLLSTPRDMYRWHRALESDRILSRRAKREMFAPHVLVGTENGITSYYGYGWGVIPRSSAGPVVEHDGGNDWSFGEFARFRTRRVMVFWITNHAYQEGRWNLEDLNRRLTLGVASRAGR